MTAPPLPAALVGRGADRADGDDWLFGLDAAVLRVRLADSCWHRRSRQRYDEERLLKTANKTDIRRAA
jgi:hypothetical protein